MCCIFSSVKWSSYTNGTWPGWEEGALAGEGLSRAPGKRSTALVGRGVFVATVPTPDHMGSCHIFPPQISLNNLFPITVPPPLTGPGIEEEHDKHVVGRRGLADLVISKVLCTSRDQQPPGMAARGNLLIAAGRDPVVHSRYFQKEQRDSSTTHISASAHLSPHLVFINERSAGSPWSPHLLLSASGCRHNPRLAFRRGPEGVK